MRLIELFTLLVLISGCTNRPMELSDKCKEIVESDSFYYAAPLLGGNAEIEAMWKLDNFITTVGDLEIETVDFDCIVAVNPTREKLEYLREIDKEHFQEILRISTKHVEATKCVTESRSIKFVEARGQLIRFKTGDQMWDLDMQKDKFGDWKFILFKAGEEPRIVPNVQMTFDEIDKYFETETSR